MIVAYSDGYLAILDRRNFPPYLLWPDHGTKLSLYVIPGKPSRKLVLTSRAQMNFHTGGLYIDPISVNPKSPLFPTFQLDLEADLS